MTENVKKLEKVEFTRNITFRTYRSTDLQLFSQASTGKTQQGYQKAIFRSVTV